MEEHIKFLRRCFHLADGLVEESVFPFASILVIDGEIRLESLKDDSRGRVLSHSEMNLIVMATQQCTDEERARGILYSNAEPCGMCSVAMYNSGIRHVVFGTTNEALLPFFPGGPFHSLETALNDAYDEVTVVGPMLQEEAMRPFLKFFGNVA